MRVADPGIKEQPDPALTLTSLWFANIGQTGRAVIYKGWGLVQLKLAPSTKAIIHAQSR